ncbi:MAG: HlyD family efflux transporter periplasmic adaptor subunit [Anaerovoracaceae bacterium]
MKKDKRRSRIIVATAVFLAACVGLYAFIYVIPGISGALTRTVIVSYGNLRVTDEAEAYLIRNEVVLSAGQTGTVSYYVNEGAKTRKGTKVLDIYPPNGSVTGYYSGYTGVVSYYIDGYEAYFSPERLTELDPAEFDDISIIPENTHRETVHAGEPLYKIVLDDVWYAVITVSEDRLFKYTTGAAVTLEFGDDSVPAYTTELLPKEEGWLVVIRTDKYYEPFATIRKTPLRVVTEDYQGLIIPNTAIAEEEGVQGVYVRDLTGEFHFTRIRVITTDGKDSLVYSGSFNETDSDGQQTKVNTVEIYDEILRHIEPEQGSESH